MLSSRDPPNLGIEPISPALAGRFFTTGKPFTHVSGVQKWVYRVREDRKRGADGDRQTNRHTHTHIHTHTDKETAANAERGREEREGERDRERDKKRNRRTGRRERTWQKLTLFMKSFMENHSVPSYSLKSSHFREGEILCHFPYMQNLKRNDTNELIHGLETHRFRERTYDCQWERKEGRDS